MDVRSAILQRISDRFMRFRAAFERFNDETAEREMVGPKWNVRDLAGHLAHWTAYVAQRVPELAKGSAPSDVDFNRVNDEVFRKNRRMSFVMLLPQLRSAENQALAAVGRVSPEHLIDGSVRDCIDEGLIEHYDHHWPGLKSALERLD
jgi:hypothetical protein